MDVMAKNKKIKDKNEGDNNKSKNLVEQTLTVGNAGRQCDQQRGETGAGLGKREVVNGAGKHGEAPMHEIIHLIIDLEDRRDS